MAEILAIIEHRKQSLADASLEILSKGRQLADQSASELVAAVIGRDTEKHAIRIASWADRVLAIKDDKLEASLAEPYQKIMSPIIKERKPKLILMGHTAFSMDLAPALAVELEAPLATDCIDISMKNGNVTVLRAIYNGKVNAEYSFVPSETIIVTGRPGEFPIVEAKVNGTIEEIESPLREDIIYKKFEGHIEPEAGEIDITKPSILVAVGRGIKSKEDIALAEELAGLLGGYVACSRPVVDYGWLPPERQVGMSGKVVKPKLYIALGISGAFQHTIGMRGSETIIAVNKDPKAPIFAAADYGIIDDLFAIVPALIQRITELKR